MTDPEVVTISVRRFLEEMDRGNFDALDALCTGDYLCHFPGNPDPLDLATHKTASRIFYSAFPDFGHRIEDVFASGNRGVIRAKGSGTHRGNILGIEPSGKKVEITVIFIFRFEDGRIAEAWGEADLFGLLYQVGALPFLDGLL